MGHLSFSRCLVSFRLQLQQLFSLCLSSLPHISADTECFFCCCLFFLSRGFGVLNHKCFHVQSSIQDHFNSLFSYSVAEAVSVQCLMLTTGYIWTRAGRQAERQVDMQVDR